MHAGTEQSADGHGLVADHLGRQSESRATGQPPVFRITGHVLRSDFGGLSVGGRGHHQAQQVFQIPPAVHQFHSKPVEEFRVGRGFSLGAEFFTGAHQADAEDRFPQTIGDDPCGEGVAFVHQPPGQLQTVGLLSRGRESQAGRQPCVNLLPQIHIVASELDEGFAPILTRQLPQDRNRRMRLQLC